MTAQRNRAQRLSPSVAVAVSAERQRIASALHDDVSQLIFGMIGRAKRAAELHPEDAAELLNAVHVLIEQLQQTQDRLRAVIARSGPADAIETVPAATQRELDDFSARTGTASHLVLSAHPEPLPPALERVILNCLRQALFNIERHAQARVVVVTLDYRRDRVRLVVQDDGRGLPIGFEPRVIPVDGHHWGFTSMAEQAERQGGTVELRRIEGGTQLLLELPRPMPTFARAE
jgi:signal transduction histidine kinase